MEGFINAILQEARNVSVQDAANMQPFMDGEVIEYYPSEGSVKVRNLITNQIYGKIKLAELTIGNERQGKSCGIHSGIAKGTQVKLFSLNSDHKEFICFPVIDSDKRTSLTENELKISTTVGSINFRKEGTEGILIENDGRTNLKSENINFSDADENLSDDHKVVRKKDLQKHITNDNSQHNTFKTFMSSQAAYIDMLFFTPCMPNPALILPVVTLLPLDQADSGSISKTK